MNFENGGNPQLADDDGVRRRERALHPAGPVQHRDRSFQADARALTALQTYKSSDTYPDYWVDADNLAVEPWGKDDVEQLYVLIAARNADLHVRLTAYKVRIRVLAEKEQLAELITAEFSL